MTHLHKLPTNGSTKISQSQQLSGTMEHNDAPPIAALFHVVFDQKVGYTIAWKRSIPDLDVSGVEYHSLPSGLHEVQSDTIYFIHDGRYAGVSAFAQQEADSAHRNASFCAVGALVPLSYGRLGKSWLHAPELRRLAQQLVKRADDKRVLELYWKEHQDGNNPSTPREGRRESLAVSIRRRLSDARDGVKVDNGMTPDHPALYMSTLLDLFGPLVFPLYRAALLRKRILLLGSPPVQQNCNAVYVLSVLSGVPQSAAETLPPDTEPILRSQLLFSVGITDIGTLSNHSNNGWIATTTDDILGDRQRLYDIAVDLSPRDPGSKRRWPRLRTSDGKVVKATQRDLRRYRMLRSELRRIRQDRDSYRDEPRKTPDQRRSEDRAPLLEPQQLLREPVVVRAPLSDENEVVEPMSWTAAAYNSFIWWASAGSSREPVEAEEEARLERELLADLPDLHDALSYATSPSTATSEEDAELSDAQERATVLTAYFHRLTNHLIISLAAIVEEADDETETGVEEDAIPVTVDDVREMGLDVWSEGDREFVTEMMRLYFGRQAAVAGEGGVRLCGMRVC